MRLIDLCIYRVREIEQLKLSFGDKQLVAVLGENGSGKTTLLGCIIYLLCAEVIFKGGKERMVRDVGSGDSWISGTIQHGDHTFKLKRFVTGSVCELIYVSGSNAKPIKTPTKVQLALDGMGLTVEKVKRTLLEQGRYGGMFHSSDGDRLRLMFEIFGLTDTDEIQDAVVAEAALIPVDISIDERWTAAQAKRDGAETVLQNATIEKAALASQYARIGEARALLASSAAADAAAAEYNKLVGGRAATCKAVEALGLEVDGLGAEQAVLDAGVLAMSGDAQAAEGVINAMRTYTALASESPRHFAESTRAGEAMRTAQADLARGEGYYEKEIVGLRADIERVQAEVVKSDAVLATARRIDGLQAVMVLTRAEVTKQSAALLEIPADLDTRIRTTEEDRRLLGEQVALAKSGVCPTCKQKLPTAHECMPLEQSEPMLAACEKQLVALKDTRAVREGIVTRLTEENAKLTMADAQIREANLDGVDVVKLAAFTAAQRVAITEMKARIDVVTAGLSRQAALNKIIDTARAQYDAAQTSLARIDAAKVDQALCDAATVVAATYKARQGKAEASRAVFTDQTARLAAARVELTRLEEQLKAFRAVDSVDPVAVEAAREIVKAAAELETKWLTVNTAFGVAESESRAARQEFSTLDVLKKQNEANKRKHELINDLKHLVGVKQFPMYVAGYYVQAINALWSRELGYADTKFSAWQDETTLEFYATFHGSDQTRMLYQLSGGERQLASISYQVVINQLFAAGVDWIAFDEPTTHVDATYRPKLVQAFLKMLQRADLKDVQMFVVDHSAEFANAISDPIVLTKGE